MECAHTTDYWRRGTTAMNDDFNFKTCEFERKLDLDEIKAKLESWSEMPGNYTALGDRGGRYTPESWGFPTVYFPIDGMTVEVVTKDCDLADVDDYLCNLAQLLECKIFTEYLEYS
jgi:hypothetical protein